MKELLLTDLTEGDVVRMHSTQGVEDDAVESEYRFTVVRAGEQPECDFMHCPVVAEGHWAGPVSVRLVGSGENDADPDETISDVDREAEANEATHPCPPANGFLQVGRTVLILDNRAVDFPSRRSWHELAPVIDGLVLTREALPVAAE